MRLIPFPEQTSVAAEDQPQYLPMPLYSYGNPDGRVVCCWSLGWKERLQILLHGRIWHHILTFNEPIQPQLLETTKPLMPVKCSLSLVKKGSNHAID